MAFRKGEEAPAYVPVVPFCPVLTQTWSLLRPRRIELAPLLRDAAPPLCNSLWTTFSGEAADRIVSAIESEELT